MNGRAHFARLSEHQLGEPEVENSTMMGFPCLRVRGSFFAAVDRRGEQLVVKLPEARVQQLIEAGRGEPFAPNGRRFRQWLAVPLKALESWDALLTEAREFVRGGAR